MNRADVERVFEAYFEKYKKTEGDRTAWSAVWLETTPSGVLELNMTKCPRGTVFKIFVDKRKVKEVSGWDGFFTAMKELSEKFPGLYNEDMVFTAMESVV